MYFIFRCDCGRVLYAKKEWLPASVFVENNQSKATQNI